MSNDLSKTPRIMRLGRILASMAIMDQSREISLQLMEDLGAIDDPAEHQDASSRALERLSDLRQKLINAVGIVDGISSSLDVPDVKRISPRK